MREVELKGVASDPERVIDALRAAAATLLMAGRLIDRRYDTAAHGLAGRDHVLRLRVYTDAAGVATASLDWKGPTMKADGYKVREELSTGVADAAALAETLERLGYGVTREIERDIQQFSVHGATVRIERYPRMDTLVEVEGAPEAIEAAILATGIPRAAFTAERLLAFTQRFEARTGTRAALSARELAGDYRFSTDDV